MILPIRYYGDPILRKHCEPIKEINDEIRKIAADMIETMDHFDGAGLAAPQVGYAIRMFVLRHYNFDEEQNWTLSPPRVYINPRIVSLGEYLEEANEGCISFPKMRIPVTRPDCVVIEATDLNGNLFREELEGYNARLRMHENDHINGVLFIDRLDPKTRKQIDPVLKQIKKKTTGKG